MLVPRKFRVNSFVRSLLQKVSFFVCAVTAAEGVIFCLRPVNDEDKMILSAAVTA